MDDDFNTAAAVGHLYESFVLANKLLDEPKAARQGRAAADAGPAARDLRRLPARRWACSSARRRRSWPRRARQCARRGIDAAAVEARIAERAAARAAKDFARADEIRKALRDQGIELMDATAGTSWRVVVNGPRHARHSGHGGVGHRPAGAGGRCRPGSRAVPTIRGRTSEGPAAVVDALAQLLADLEEGEPLGLTCTASPVRGLRPWYSRYVADGEAAEATDLDAFALLERVDHAVEHLPDQQLGAAARQLRPFGDEVDEIGLGHLETGTTVPEAPRKAKFTVGYAAARPGSSTAPRGPAGCAGRTPRAGCGLVRALAEDGRAAQVGAERGGDVDLPSARW